MGKVELHKGSLIRIDTGDLTVEEYCEYICLKNNYTLPYKSSSYAEVLTETDNTYMILNGNLYRNSDNELPNDTPYLIDMKHLNYGVLSYIAQFDTDVTTLEKTLEDGLNKLETASGIN